MLRMIIPVNSKMPRVDNRVIKLKVINKKANEKSVGNASHHVLRCVFLSDLFRFFHHFLLASHKQEEKSWQWNIRRKKGISMKIVTVRLVFHFFSEEKKIKEINLYLNSLFISSI